jgi:hypothetical protein
MPWSIAVSITASVGVVPFGAAELPVEGILAAADLAMYAAKEAGGDGYHVTDGTDERVAGMQARLDWADQVRRALDEDRFQLYWQPIVEHYGIDATVVNDAVDPTFRFMTADWDGKIRMDCSSPYAMASLIQMRDRFDVAFANDTDADRHGIVTRTGGLMNPNHFLRRRSPICSRTGRNGVRTPQSARPSSRVR